MIPWWGWLLIWSGLVIALLAVVALLGWRLVKRFFALLDDVFVVTEKLSILDGVAAETEARPMNAILREGDEVRATTGARMARRAERKHARRQARIQRGKMLTTATIDLKEWPHEPR
ncbi:hypothetical protein GCM10027413_20150 [Conyzicola nivalis]|uniref:Uncharacterized protein n=1 Tax=Conyzicola nivalis TaxID=1477021 RepID=A0A916SFG6_9MICO|nr:hypothetical protein [Conyzicola nivalis]GGA94696.1 hypothetical protein GCM10010979_06470 [Conyzicola nivalis]